jgi:hypothetical protein|nr:MAG TPA: hypothetical protein [Caudoviricetes sp.]
MRKKRLLRQKIYVTLNIIKLLLYQKSEVKNMDNLTVQKKLKLISDCIAAEDSVGKLHIDVRKMYAYLAEQAVNSETSSDIKYLEIAKISLDFLVRGVVK